MLRKVLKHDLNSVWRIWLIFSITVVVLSCISGICLRELITLNEIDQYFSATSVLSELMLILTSIAIIAYLVISGILVVYRYYQNFFTDEGYLTFTLPVKRSTLLNSKLLSAFIWNIATSLVFVLCLCIILLIAPAHSDGTGTLIATVLEGIANVLYLIFSINDAWLVVYLILLAIILLLWSVFSTLLMYACVTIGSVITRKQKVLVAILIYYIVNSAISVVWYIISITFDIATQAFDHIVNEINPDILPLLTLFFMICIAMAISVISVLTYNFTLKSVQKKLNLS